MKMRKPRYYIPASLELCPLDMLDMAAEAPAIGRDQLSDHADHVLDYFETYELTQLLHNKRLSYTVRQMASHIHLSRMALENSIIELISHGFLGAPEALKTALAEVKKREKQGGRRGILNGLKLELDHSTTHTSGKEMPCMA